MKFGRSYQMTITGQSGKEITVAFPTTIDFTITHNIWASANHAEFSLYNLSATNRYEIYFNQYLKARPYPATLKAGYISQQGAGFFGSPNELPIVFKGYSNVAYTERSGPDLVTRINALDNGDITSDKPPAFLDGKTNSYTALKGTDFVSMVKGLMRKLVNVAVGDVVINPTQMPLPLTKDRPFIGSVWDQLQILAKDAGGADVFIENGVCNMLSQNSFLPLSNNLGTLESETGLLGIPKFTGATCLVSCIFEPSLRIGASIKLKSSVTPWVDGPYKIVAYTHRGTISGIQSGDLISDITLASQYTTLNG